MRPYEQQRPRLGGGRQVPFDGEAIGRFLRFAILHEVRANLTGEELDHEGPRAEFETRMGLTSQTQITKLRHMKKRSTS